MSITLEKTTEETTIVLGLELAGTLMTPEEFDAVEDYDEEYRYELIHGVLIVSPPPSPLETSPNDELGHLLRKYRDEHPKGFNLDLTVPEQHIRTHDSCRRADRAIWAGLGRVPNVKNDLPTVVVEFVSAGKRSRQRDYVEKRKEYLKLGIAEYWIVDRFRRQMTVFRRTTGESSELVVKEDQTYTTPLLPGFELTLARLIAEAEKIDRAQEAPKN